MIITHKLEMDMMQREMVQRIDVVQGDCNTRQLELTLRSDGEDWPVPEGAAVWLRYCKSDGTKGIYDTLPDGTAAWKAEGNLLTVSLAPQVLTAVGDVVVQVVLVDESSEPATFAVKIHVERNPAAGVIASEDYINMLHWMEEKLDRLLLQAKESGAFDGPRGEAATGVFDYAVEVCYAGDKDAFREIRIIPCFPLSGGAMAGAIDMAGQALSGLITSAASSDAATKYYVDQKHQRTMVTLKANEWGDSALYIQNVSVPAMLSSDWPGIEAALDTDRARKTAMECIDYIVLYERDLSLYGLENKPEGDIMVCVEMIR